MLNIGADNFVFPIPLQKNSSGQWYFNTAAGRDEILARRIGKNELTAIAAADSIANAEQQYFRSSSVIRAEKTGCTGLFPKGRTKVLWVSWVTLPRPRVTPLRARSRGRSMATTSEYLQNKEARPEAARRTTS